MNALTTVTTLTPTRMGMGQAVGLIDLPVHREASTNWPVLSGSGIKGVLKDASKRTLEADQATKDGFKTAQGSNPQLSLSKYLDDQLKDLYGTADGGGSLVVTDLFCLLFPVRSCFGVFAWVTCPLALERAADMAKMIGAIAPAVPNPLPTFPSEGNPTAVIHNAGSVIANQNTVALDELDLTANSQDLSSLATWISDRAPLTRERLLPRLAVLHDDIFTFLTEQGTEVRTKTALEYRVKKVKDKSLRQEEYIPTYAVFLGIGEVPDDKRVNQEGALQIGSEASTGAGLVQWKVNR